MWWATRGRRQAECGVDDAVNVPAWQRYYRSRSARKFALLLQRDAFSKARWFSTGGGFGLSMACFCTCEAVEKFAGVRNLPD